MTDEECCKVKPEEQALLDTGEYTPEELWGGRRPTCPKCIDRKEKMCDCNQGRLPCTCRAL